MSVLHESSSCARMDSRGGAVPTCDSLGLKPGSFLTLIGTTGSRALPGLKVLARFGAGVCGVNSGFLTGPAAPFGMTSVVRVSAAYAALKRRSSTVALAVVASPIVSVTRWKAIQGQGRRTRVSVPHESSSCARMDSRGRLSLHVPPRANARFFLILNRRG